MSQADTLPTHSVGIDDVVITVIMARVTDFFGFFVYAIASVLVFPQLFFPQFDPVAGTLWSFAIFSLAFLARPLASFLGRWLQTKIGRTGKITVALMILGTSSVAIGLLPGHAEIGWTAALFLAILRFAQGIGLGGAWDGITLQLKSLAPREREGIYGMIPQLGGPIGFCVAASLFYVLTGFLSEEEFYGYGWRFAFFAVLAVNVVSLFARIRLLSATFDTEDETMQSAPLGELVREEGSTIVMSTFLPLASYALLHMVTIFPLCYVLLFSEHSMSEFLLLEVVGGAIAIGTVILSGILADKYSRRMVMRISTCLIPLLCLTIYTLNSAPWIYVLLGFAILGLTYGQSSSIVPKRFKAKYRYSGSALATNMSWIIGAAFAPFCGLFLASTFGLWAAALYLMSGAVVTLITLQVLEQRLAKEV